MRGSARTLTRSLDHNCAASGSGRIAKYWPASTTVPGSFLNREYVVETQKGKQRACDTTAHQQDGAAVDVAVSTRQAKLKGVCYNRDASHLQPMWMLGRSKATQSRSDHIYESSTCLRSTSLLPPTCISTRGQRLAHRHLHTSRNLQHPPATRAPSSPPNPPLPPPPPSPLPGLGTTQLSPDILLRCTIFDSTGSATSTSGIFKKSHLCAEHGLEPRDLRKIDSRVPNLVPTILARRGGILVNILHIRAMVKRDKVLLFDSYGSTDSQLHSAFVYNLQHNLKPHSHTSSGSGSGSTGSGGGGSGLAYEFRALESILVSVLDALRIELGVVRSWTGKVLEELDDDVDREKLRELLQVSRKLNAFLSRGKAVKGAVVEVLENEEDMALMYLSASGQAPDSTSSKASPSETTTSASSMDELELLLESFDKQVEEVVAETTQLHSDMTNTQEVVELILDNNRNSLLALDLKTSIATMGISAGTLWAGLFGMNLRSGLEEMQWVFAGVSGVAFLGVAVVAGVGLRRLERLRRVGLGMKGKKREGKGRWGWVERWRGARVESRRGADAGGAGQVPIGVGSGYGAMYGYPQPWNTAAAHGYTMHSAFHPASPSAAVDQHHHPAHWPHPYSPIPPSPSDAPFPPLSSTPAPPPPTQPSEAPQDSAGAKDRIGLESKRDTSSTSGGPASKTRAKTEV